MAGGKRYVSVIVLVWLFGGGLSLWWNVGEIGRHR